MAAQTDKPRNDAIKAAMYDSAVLAALLEDEFRATYIGPERSEYLRVLGGIVSGLGGSLESTPSGASVAYAGRRIAIRFGR
jgi:hypothetical protein